MSNIEWGPAIEVDGKRPAWLVGADKFQWEDGNRSFGVWDADQCTTGDTFCDSSWWRLTYIRLPADHQHYKKAEATRIMQAAIAENGPPTKPVRTAAEMLDRLEALARRLAGHMRDDGTINLSGILYVGQEARAIVAEMTPPVDPDLILARQIEHDILVENEMDGTPALRGEWDDKPGVRGVLRAVKRGRELERGE